MTTSLVSSNEYQPFLRVSAITITYECNEYQPFLRQNKVSAITMTTSLVSSTTSVTSTSRSFDKTK